MPVIKGIDASVKVNGKRLDEYTCEDEGDNISKRPFEMTRYIEANSGANFAITVSYNKVAFGKAYSNQALQFDVIVDGTYMDNVVMRADSGTLNGRRVWDTMKQASLEKFKFSDIKICLKVLLKTPEQITDGEVDEDDDSSAMPMGLNTISELGSITVKILRVRSITTSVPKTEAARPLFGSGGAIPEKALKGKALSHQTRLDNATPIPPPPTVSCQFVDQPSTPFAIFIFKYRSRAALEALMIIRPGSIPTASTTPTNGPTNGPANLPAKITSGASTRPRRSLSFKELLKIPNKSSETVRTQQKRIKQEPVQQDNKALLLKRIRETEEAEESFNRTTTFPPRKLVCRHKWTRSFDQSLKDSWEDKFG